MLKPFTLMLMTYALSAESSRLITLQIAGALDLAGLAVGIWTLWSAISLPLEGKFQRAFRLIGFGTVAFAASHLLDSLVAGFQILPGNEGFVIMQGAVLASMLLFVPGLADLADILPTLPSSRQRLPLPRIWPIIIGLVICIGAFSFVVYGFTPEAEVVALIGLDVGLIFTAGLCVFLLLRARIGGVIGRSLWLTLVGLLLFSLAHPLQIWLVEEASFPAAALAVLHRLIVMPALILFAFSIARVARALSHALTMKPTLISSYHEQKDLSTQALHR